MAKRLVSKTSSVWSRGAGFLGALGSGDWSARDEFKELEKSVSAVDISAGWAHSAAVTPESRRVVIWGRSLDPAVTLLRVNQAQIVWPALAHAINALSLALDTGGQFALRPTILPVDSRAKSVICGAGITLILGEEGALWSYGCNEYGQAGVGKISTCVMSPQRVKLDTPIIQAAMGLRHGLALDADGRVYAWGKNENGQLGTGDIEEIAEPSQPLDLPAISAVAAGFSHSAALSTHGEVFVWGKMRSNRSFREKKKSFFSDYVPPVRSDATRPRLLQFPPGTPPMTHLACSGLHTVTIDQQGDVWAMGLEKHSRDMVTEPRRMIMPTTLPPSLTAHPPSWTLRSGTLTTALFLADCPTSPVYHPVLQGGVCLAEHLFNAPEGRYISNVALGWKHQLALVLDDEQESSADHRTGSLPPTQ